MLRTPDDRLAEEIWCTPDDGRGGGDMLPTPDDRLEDILCPLELDVRCLGPETVEGGRGRGIGIECGYLENGVFLHGRTCNGTI